MEQPLVDGLVMSLTCMASPFQINSAAHFDITWSGVGIGQQSIWLHQAHSSIQGNVIKKKLVFRPLLASHAGKYACYLMMNKEVVASRSIVVSGM